MKKYLFPILLLAPFILTASSRTIWVTRWDYSTPSDIEKIIENAVNLEFDKILFQVRGNGTVAYPSQYETWSKQFNEIDPGWDPLQCAITKAHRNNIELHAWINVYPGWHGPAPPENQNQLYHKHPSWFAVNMLGNPQVLNDNYMWLSPTHPDVKRHILKICKELLLQYDIDGIHLDYCRYPGQTYSYDERSIQLFESIYQDSPQNILFSWRNWRQRAVTELITSIHNMIRAERPTVCLSAAVIGDLYRGEKLFLQETDVWMRRGIIDAVYPMIYTEDMYSFKYLVKSYLEKKHNCRVYAGIYLYQADQLRDQLNFAVKAGCHGTAVFSYDRLASDHIINPIFAEQLRFSEQRVPPVLPPFIEQLKTIPANIHRGEPFRIAVKLESCYICDCDKSQAPVLVVDQVWPPLYPQQLSMSPVVESDRWLVSEQSVIMNADQLQCGLIACTNCRTGLQDYYQNSGPIWSIQAEN